MRILLVVLATGVPDGVGTDYIVFMLFRYREKLGKGQEGRQLRADGEPEPTRTPGR